MRNVTLILDDGSRFSGKSFGYEKPVAGEVVFNTAMTGYPESLTDPSYAGQLMTLTYPLVGNYGVPPFTIEPNGLATFMESEKIHAEAIIVDFRTECPLVSSVQRRDSGLQDLCLEVLRHIPERDDSFYRPAQFTGDVHSSYGYFVDTSQSAVAFVGGGVAIFHHHGTWHDFASL